MTSTVDDALDRFRSLADLGPYGDPWCHHHAGEGRHEQHTVFGFIIHGNENGTLPAALRLVEALRSGEVQTGGPVSVLLGNPAAAREDVRFLEEDFNRVFTFDRPAESLERRRAESVRAVLDAADLFLDFHQTQTPTESAFWTFPWDTRFGHWARVAAVAPVGITRAPGQVFSKGTCCLDEYVRGRGKIGITAELGMRGEDADQANAAFEACVRVLSAVDAIAAGATTLSARADAERSIRWYRTAHVVPARDAHDRLRPGVENWMPVEGGERLSAVGTPEIVAPEAGVVLFPKYPRDGDPPPPELFRIGVPVDDPELL